jgi:hypothetical protein
LCSEDTGFCHFAARCWPSCHRTAHLLTLLTIRMNVYGCLEPGLLPSSQCPLQQSPSHRLDSRILLTRGIGESRLQTGHSVQLPSFPTCPSARPAPIAHSQFGAVTTLSRILLPPLAIPASSLRTLSELASFPMSNTDAHLTLSRLHEHIGLAAGLKSPSATHPPVRNKAAGSLREGSSRQLHGIGNRTGRRVERGWGVESGGS